MIGDCTTCGYPTLRSGAHADWCERVAAYNAQWEYPDLCTIGDCGSPHHARGLCQRHYQAARKNGMGLAA